MATKRLARQLGILRRSSKSSPDGQSHRSKLRQVFDYLIIIDFESTCWRDGRKHYGQEIIEFPAVLLNTANGKIESEFHMYVQPQEHPVLSEFCTELTGITQNQVDEGVPLPICLSQFSKWIQKIQKEKKIIFDSALPNATASEGKLCAFVTWSELIALWGSCLTERQKLGCGQILLVECSIFRSAPEEPCPPQSIPQEEEEYLLTMELLSFDWDLGVCLQYECKRKQLRQPEILHSWIDLRATYKLFYSRRPQGLNGALQDLGIVFAGREHSGLDDSRNTARLAWRMIRDGCVMKITKSLHKAPPGKNSIARFLNAKPTEASPLGSSSSAKTSGLGKNGDCESTSLIKKDTGEEQPEYAPVCLYGSIPILSRNRSKTAGCGSVPSYLTPPAGRLHSPIGCLQPFPCSIQSGLSNRRLMAKNAGLVLVSTTLSSINDSDMDIGTTSDCLSTLADWEDFPLIPESDQSSEGLPLEDHSGIESSPVSGERTDASESDVRNLPSEGAPEMTLNEELSESVVYKSPNTTIYRKGTAPGKSSNASVFKLPAAKTNTASMPSNGDCLMSASEALKRKPSSPPPAPPGKKPPFDIYKDKDAPSINPFRRSVSRPAPCGILNSSSNQNRSFRFTENGKVTPPLCKCGRRARRLQVSKGGPNHGKAFFSCPAGKQEGNRKSCGYFKWEHTLLKDKCTLPSSPFSPVGRPSPGTTLHSSGNTQKKCLGLRPSMRT